MSAPFDIPVDPERLLADLTALAAIGDVGRGGSRRALSATDIEGRRWLRQRMEEADLDAEMDSMGTVLGRPSDGRPSILVGSHTDTVPQGGWLDGALGVLLGLEIARAWPRTAEFGVSVVSFSDEEGRFSPLLGSRLFCGALGFDEAQGLGDDSGMTVAAARAAVGLAGSKLLRLDLQRHRAFLEVHIEQGPVLEHEGIPIGVVSDIVGIGRELVVFSGQADHAGTTPMAMRRDAGRAAVLFADTVDALCRDIMGDEGVWNIGAIRMRPAAYNVVPERAEVLVEYRSSSENLLDRIRERIPGLATEAAERARVREQVIPAGRVPGVAMDAGMRRRIGEAAAALNLRTRPIASGAGHDAMVLAPRIPSGMIFVPSIGGRSHTPEEDTRREDIAAGLAVAARTVAATVAELQGRMSVTAPRLPSLSFEN